LWSPCHDEGVTGAKKRMEERNYQKKQMGSINEGNHGAQGGGVKGDKKRGNPGGVRSRRKGERAGKKTRQNGIERVRGFFLCGARGKPKGRCTKKRG